MSQRNRNIVPGWKMTFDQRNKYWRMFGDICRVLGWEPTDESRYDWHEASGLGRRSVKEIGHLDDFDEIKKYWLAVTQPDNLEAQIKMANMKRTRLMTRIRNSFPEPYWRALLASPLFKAKELEDLDEKHLTDLRNTCEARFAEKEEMPF